MNRRAAFLTLTLALAPLMPALAGGAQAQTAPAGAVTTADVSNDSTVLFMDRTSMGNLAEISTSQLALQKSRNADVRAYAQKMIADHTPAQARLLALAAQKGIKVSDKPGADQRLMANKLATLSGAAFDMEYVKVQVMGHEGTLAVIDTYLSIGRDPQAIAYARSIRPAVVMHLQMARDMMAKMM